MEKNKEISYEEFEEFIERYFLQSVKEMKDYNDEQNDVESVEQYKSTIDVLESKFWVNKAKKEYFFTEDREITYEV